MKVEFELLRLTICGSIQLSWTQFSDISELKANREIFT